MHLGYKITVFLEVAKADKRSMPGTDDRLLLCIFFQNYRFFIGNVYNQTHSGSMRYRRIQRYDLLYQFLNYGTSKKYKQKNYLKIDHLK